MRDDEFEWDDAKAATNLASHRVSFEDARLAFDDPFAVEREDRRESYGEERYILLGMVAWPVARSRLHDAWRTDSASFPLVWQSPLNDGAIMRSNS